MRARGNVVGYHLALKFRRNATFFVYQLIYGTKRCMQQLRECAFRDLKRYLKLLFKHLSGVCRLTF